MRICSAILQKPNDSPATKLKSSQFEHYVVLKNRNRHFRFRGLFSNHTSNTMLNAQYRGGYFIDRKQVLN